MCYDYSDACQSTPSFAWLSSGWITVHNNRAQSETSGQCSCHSCLTLHATRADSNLLRYGFPLFLLIIKVSGPCNFEAASRCIGVLVGTVLRSGALKCFDTTFVWIMSVMLTVVPIHIWLIQFTIVILNEARSLRLRYGIWNTLWQFSSKDLCPACVREGCWKYIYTSMFLDLKFGICCVCLVSSEELSDVQELGS